MHIVFKKYLLFFSTLSFFGWVHGQTTTELYHKGESQLFKGRSDLAIETFNTAYKKTSDKTSLEAALYLNEIGIAHWNEGNTEQALSHLEEALRVRSVYHAQNKSLMAASYNDIGLVYSTFDDDKALENYSKSLEFYKADSSLYSIKIAQLLMNIGIINLHKGNYNSAQINFTDAKVVFEQQNGSTHPSVAFALANIGKVYKARKIYNVAITTYEEALQIYQNSYGQKHPEIAQVYDAIGQCYLQKEEYKIALDFYQKALIASIPSFNSTNIAINPKISDQTPQVVLHTLLLKSQAFDAYYANHSLKIRDLKRALACLESCDTLIDILRHKKENSKDKIALGILAEEVYDNAIRIAFDTYQVSWVKEKYKELTFYFSEKAKSAVLLEAITEAKAKNFANIPQEVLETEKNIKAELTFLEQQLLLVNDSTRAILESQLLQLNNQYHNFITDLETQYPDYYQLKYAINIASVKDLQKIIDGETSVWSYFISNNTNTLYVFYISESNYRLKRIPLNSDIAHDVKYFRNTILYQSKKKYIQYASTLNKLLFPVKKLTAKTIIIPHGALGLIPFEALLTETPKVEEYEKLPYLCLNTSVSYSYSATLFLQNTHQRQPINDKALVIAPIKFNHIGGDNTRSGLNDLPGTSFEARMIKKILGDKVTLDTLHNATESTIKATNLKDFSIIHFATHGEVNEETPELSRILLAQEEHNKNEDGSLFAGEIFNLENNADLIVLSACQTGVGKITKGEGIIGLTRALIYSGAENLIVSLWKVADESTAQLMMYFYEEISTKKNYSYSLKTAKNKLIEQKEYASPYYWAPFILVGK